MIRYKNIVIIGTSHIARESMEEVRKAIEDEKPGIVAIELDKKRLYALQSGQKKGKLPAIRPVELKGFLFSLIGAWAERKLGEVVGVSPGSEMKEAIFLARKQGIKIMLIDQDIEVTLQRFSQALSWKEKWNFFVDIVKAFVLRKKEVDFDLRKVPGKKLINTMLNKVKQRYPNIYMVLIDERNLVMARNLEKIMQSHPDEKVVAVVGAGHEDGLSDLLSERDISYSFSVRKKKEIANASLAKQI